MGDDTRPLDKTAHHELGDDRGEGGERDIRTDKIEIGIGGTPDGPGEEELGQGAGLEFSEDRRSAAAGGQQQLQKKIQRQQGDQDLDDDEGRDRIDNQGMR